MRRWIAVLLVPCVAAPPVSAAPGITTSDVNLRTGPGTDFDALTVLPQGTAIDIGDCDGGWCAVSLTGVGGFISDRYVEEVATPPPVEAPADPRPVVDGTLGEAELDALVAPIALYPDSLLAQVLVAATVPLDVVKAGRWVEANTALAAAERSAKVETEGWDESVAALAAGFPSVIKTLNDDLDWTERLGDAVMSDGDAVLEAVQRQRARAQAVGNLETNEAQVVTVVNDTIAIAPASTEVVYVPSYNPQTVYVEAAPVAAPVYVETGYGYDTGAAIAAGTIGFFGGLLVGEVFDDDWDDYWDGPRVDWDNGDFYPDPDFDIDIDRGDINIDRGDINIDGDINIGDRPGDRPGIGDRPGDRPGIGDRPGDRPGVADGRPSQLPARDGAWRPSDGQRNEARQKIADRQGGRLADGGSLGEGAGGALAGAAGGALAGAAGGALAGAALRPPGGRPSTGAIESKLKAGSGGAVGRPSAGQRPAARPPGQRAGAFDGQGAGMSKTKKAAARGQTSKARKAGAKPAQRQAPARAAKPRAPQQVQRAAPQQRTAFQQSRGGSRSVHASARGNRSMGGHRGGGGSRGGGGRGGGRGGRR